MHILNSILGILFIFLVGYLLSTNKRNINWRTLLVGFIIQFLFALIVLKWSFGQFILQKIANGVSSVIDYANEGINFLFGPIISSSSGLIFGIQVLPVIIFISSVVAVFYYLGVMQVIVRIIGGGLSKLLGTSKLETLSAAANIFLGQTEAPLLIKPYIDRLSESEIFTVMVGGLASVSGSVLVGYSLLGVPLNYLIAASFMSAPAGLVISKLMFPEKKSTAESESIKLEKDTSVNIVDAASRGAGDGLNIALNVGAMLIAFISIVALINGLIGFIGGWFGITGLSLQSILGYIFAPVAIIIGVPINESLLAGSFIGQKLILNEFVAFTNFGPVINTLSSKSVAIITFALCGFANISSLAILIGGIGGMCPKQKPTVAKLSGKAIIAGTLANLLSAALAGLFIG